ncbi:MAG: hypothetical protein QOJ35_2764 [Solirubrobacteraceae bacterium]|nr:hypothetical protein [Solirubrobacteraceae bacterium]
MYCDRVSPLRPIPLNVGGPLAPEHVIGRTAEVADVFRSLASVGVVITGERRMGKTSLARVIARDAEIRGWTVVWQSAEGFTSIAEFCEALIPRMTEVGGRLGTAVRAVVRALKIELGPLRIDPRMADRLLDDVVSAAVGAAGQRLLLVIDELPLFVRELDRRHPGDGAAALHLLRRLRERHGDRLRMLCLGSVGFHHVARGALGALNDLERHRLGPLAPQDASYLARGIMLATSVSAPNESELADAIGAAAEGVPFYVHRLVAQIVRRAPTTCTVATVGEIVEEALRPPDDPWELRHYRDRVRPYYGEDAPVAAAVLDALAPTREAVARREVESRVATSAAAPVDHDRFRDVVERLVDDHYLVYDGDALRFAFDLVRRAWGARGR